MTDEVQYYRQMSPNWGVVARVWWLYFWRGTAMSIAGGALVGFIVGFAHGLLGFDAGLRTPIILVGSALFGLLSSILAVSMGLRKRYRGFRLVIVMDGPGAELEPPAQAGRPDLPVIAEPAGAEQRHDQ